MQNPDTILSINEVQPRMAKALPVLSENLGREIKGVTLIDANYYDSPLRAKFNDGSFEEVVVDFDDAEALRAAIDALNPRLLAATCRSERSIPYFQKAIPYLTVPTPSVDSLTVATNKQLMRKAFASADPALNPTSIAVENADAATIDMLCEQIDFPMIVKPSGLNASLLVSECNSREELESALQTVFEKIEEVYARVKGRGTPTVLVEEKIIGDMFSIDGYVSPEGEITCIAPVGVITGKMIGLDDFFGYRRSTPTDLTDQEIAEGQAAVTKAVQGLGLTSSIFHGELFKTEKGWKMIEVAPRMGGYRDAMYEEAFGIQHSYNDIATRIPSDLIVNHEPLAHAAAFNFYPETEGMVVAVEGLEQAKELASTVTIGTKTGVGKFSAFSRNGGEPVVEAVLANTDKAQLEADVVKLEDLIKITVE